VAPDAAPGVDARPTVDAQAPGPDAATGCAAITCPDNAFCQTSSQQCECLTGFAEDGQGHCVAIDPGDPAARTQQQMCARWTADRQWTATTVWTAGQNQCDPGVLSSEAIADGVACINLYRFLTGLSPLQDDAGANHTAQLCSVIQNAQGYLSHQVDASAPCYTAEGAQGAASSNLALGVWSPADAVDLFISDGGVPSLGHRRWVLNPSYGPAGIGFAGNASCLGVFSWGNTSDVEFVAWPNQGFTPVEVIPPTWSFSPIAYGFGASPAVTVRRASDQVDLAVTASVLPSGYGPDTVGFTPAGWWAAAGETYEITVTGLGGSGSVVYQVKPVSCP
jgi:uncharacterized protein YkwD